MDLSCAYLYLVDDSVFDRPYCFQLVERALPCLATITYLSAASLELYQVCVNPSEHTGNLQMEKVLSVHNTSSMVWHVKDGFPDVINQCLMRLKMVCIDAVYHCFQYT